MVAIMKGEPLVAKLAAAAKYVVLPGTMVWALIYYPPRYGSSEDNKSPKYDLTRSYSHSG